ncbi:MAG: phosphoribosylanthranilate isomerase [Ahrensia sp.]|nr:phosphoribosylanthranilate isomerase [Ahrensia sp.]
MIFAVKICGLSSLPAIEAAVGGDASHLGFIFFERSPRHVSVDRAASLAQHRKSAKAVAVTVDADDAYLDAIVSLMAPDMLQLHGAETVERLHALKSRYGLPTIKALSIRSAADMAKVHHYDGEADMLLLDAKPPKGSGLPGGNGVSFDWSLIDNLQTKSPVLLSGGIDCDNLRGALERVSSPGNTIVGFDLSSGVESAPGVKDIAKIAEFLDLCKQAQAA